MPRPSAAGFEFDPSWLVSGYPNIKAAVKNSSRSMAATKGPDGGYTVRYQATEEVSATFKAGPQTGFNVSSFQAFLKEGASLYQDSKMTWKRSGGLWFVQAIDFRLNRFDGSGERIVLTYDTFEPNAKVSPDLFGIKALELPNNARILDRRR